MVFSLKRFSLIIVLLSLSACGGGGSGAVKNTTREVVYADAFAAYKENSGITDQAQLTKDNGMAFVRAFFADNVGGKVFLSTSKPSESGLSELKAQKSIAAIGEKSFSAQMNMKYRASESATEACIGGGTVTVTEEIDKKTNTGALFTTMSDCVNENGVTMNGKMLIHVTKYSTVINEASEYVLSFDNVTMSYKGKTYTTIGTQSYTLTDDYFLTVITNLLKIDAQGKQQLLKDFKVVNSKNFTGKLYLGGYGYVDISTPEPVVLDQNSKLITSGKMLFNGASASKILLSPQYNFNSHKTDMRVDLDENGDNHYEYILVLANSVDWSKPKVFSLNKPPVIELLDVVTIEDELKVNNDILISVVANDPEGEGLTYTWSIDLAPAGANANITSQGGGVGAKIIADKVGNYQVKVTVTDASGNSSINTVSFIIKKNENPTAVITMSGSFILGTYTHLDAINSSDIEGNISSYFWEIVEKPNGSAVSIDIIDRTNRLLSFYPDRGGEYRFKLTVTDDQGQTGSTIEPVLIPLNQAPIARITQVFSGPNEPGVPIQLSGITSSDPDLHQSITGYTWILLSKPANSSVSIPDSMKNVSEIDLLSDVEGSYIFELTVTDGFGGSNSVRYTVYIEKLLI